MNDFKEFAQSLSPHPSKARILLELDQSEGIVKKVLNILQSDGGAVEYEIFQKENTIWLHVLIPSQEMQESVLRLTEAGYTRIRGVSAQYANY